ncbi:LOW QUALITY PROTEIN: hypothetical protein PanWU01x14_253430 [Parasponia andersonii]|uniref:Uncharacterized protein n=1 Tax=Parasponia andersonii TaxID=3476 RepID=A0A2P5BBQ4_PARAD|nr:LOW QUALITY PROTEIN: hypothetical protein PanWU01x14_253430 [Parasponia andersonii]
MGQDPVAQMTYPPTFDCPHRSGRSDPQLHIHAIPTSKFPTLLPALFPSPSSPAFFTILSKYLSSSSSPLRFDPPHIPNLSLLRTITQRKGKRKRKREHINIITHKYTLKKRMSQLSPLLIHILHPKLLYKCSTLP